MVMESNYKIDKGFVFFNGNIRDLGHYFSFSVTLGKFMKIYMPHCPHLKIFKITMIILIVRILTPMLCEN